MTSANSFSPELFNLAHWDLSSNDSIHSMANFLHTFTNTIIRPDDGRNAPLEQATSFILLIADPKIFYATRLAIPELWLTSTPFPSTPNPWLKAVRAVAAPCIPEGFMNEPETYMLDNKSVAVVMALAALKENAPPEKRHEIDDLTWAFVGRVTENVPPSPVSLRSL